MSINTNQLQNGATFLVRGKVGFSRITRKTTDQERAAANQRRAATAQATGKPSYPIDKNYTQLTIYDATVIAKDPSNPTIEEKYAAEHLYTSKADGYTGQCYNAINKGNTLPSVSRLVAPNVYQPIVPENELARGLDVTMVLRVFGGRAGMNNGVTLDRVLVNEQVVRYRDGFSDQVTNNLKNAYGITFMEPEKPLDNSANDEAEASAAPVDDGSDAAPVAPNAFSAPNVAPIGGPNDTPFSSAGDAGGYQFQPGAGRVY